MLENPNLSAEKMFDVLASGKDIIGIAFIIIVILLIYLYRFEISQVIKYGFSKDRNDKSIKNISQLMKMNFSELEKKNINNKVDNLIHKFGNPVLDNEDTELLENVDNLINSNSTKHIPPIFRILKIIKTSREIVCYFVNDSGAIHNIKINSIEGINVSIEPKNKIEAKVDGYFKFEFSNNNVGNEVIFDLSYYDENNKSHKEKYVLSTIENKISIVEME